MAFIWDLTRAAAGAARDIANAALFAHPEAAAGAIAPAVTIGKLILTGGQVRALYDVAAHLVTGTANVPDEEAIADIVIDAALMAAGPVVATLAAPAAEALAGLIIEGIASGAIRGDPDPVHDAQTQLGRGGRRG